MEKVTIGNAELWHGDCLGIWQDLPEVDAVISDPPYPNGADLFVDGIKKAKAFICLYECKEWLLFWDEMTEPPAPQPLVAKHAWHRTNTNRPDNYEIIYHYHQDGKKKASRILPFAVIAVGLTGCTEATGHPTQKNVKLMERLITMTKANVILDPFMGSGTTGVAAMNLEKQFIGIERERKYFDIACERIDAAQAQGRLAI
jgi:site-specific DNA-methyltransferase (adenine-specific)